MQIQNVKKFRYILSLGLLLLLIIVFPILAVGKPDTVGGRPDSTGNIPSRVPAQAQNRLTAAKLKACQARENAIQKRSKQLGQLATTMEEKFDAIAGRVEEYYTTKVVVPSGKTVTDYNALVADIQTKKTAVRTALAQAQTNANTFSCTNDDPKGQMTKFKDDMRGVIKALQDYRTSIKNLIVAVRSVTGTARNE